MSEETSLKFSSIYSVEECEQLSESWLDDGFVWHSQCSSEPAIETRHKKSCWIVWKKVMVLANILLVHSKIISYMACIFLVLTILKFMFDSLPKGLN